MIGPGGKRLLSRIWPLCQVDNRGEALAEPSSLVTFGGAKDDVGPVIVARPEGFDALTALLRKFPILPAQVETGIRVLTSQPRPWPRATP